MPCELTCPSFSPSYGKPQPCPANVPTKSVFLIPACWSFRQRKARQQPFGWVSLPDIISGADKTAYRASSDGIAESHNLDLGLAMS
jgi:hypothetical protein